MNNIYDGFTFVKALTLNNPTKTIGKQNLREDNIEENLSYTLLLSFAPYINRMTEVLALIGTAKKIMDYLEECINRLLKVDTKMDGQT